MKSEKLKFRVKDFLLLVILLLTFNFLFFTSTALAVDYLPLVPCGLKEQPTDSEGNRIGDPDIDYTAPCARCDTFRLGKNVIDFVLIGIIPPTAAVLFIIGGLMIVFSGARPELIATGKKIFWNTFIGLLIILSAWLVANTFIKSFAPAQADAPWYRLVCDEDSPIITVGGGPPPPPIIPPGQINACAQCSAYPGGVIAGGGAIQCVGQYLNTNQPLNNPAKTCPFADFTVAANLVKLREVKSNWVLSEGFPPTANHASLCHGNGSCVDIVVNPRPPDEDRLIQELNEVCNAAVVAGFPRSKIINEYVSLKDIWPSGPTGCPAPRRTNLTTGDHLHLAR